MRILITGATGGIGQELLRQWNFDDEHTLSVLVRRSKKNQQLIRKYPKLHVIYGDVTDQAVLESALLDQDLIYHLAALIPTAERKNMELIEQVNVGATQRLVEILERKNPKAHLIFSSSVAVYGDRVDNPMISVDDEIYEDPSELYSSTKIRSEAIIRTSSLNWTILRLSAIMGVGNHKFNPAMFEIALDTSMEIATLRDTARALRKSIDHLDVLNHKVFNLSGGHSCRITYREFLNRAFEAYGLGPARFPNHSFATKHSHCGFFTDSNQLESILHFQQQSIDDFFAEFRAAVPAWQRAFTRPFAPIVRRILSSYSEPLKSYSKNDKLAKAYYFGES